MGITYVYQGLCKWRNKYHDKFNSDGEKVSDIVPSNYFTRCVSGESYEMGFPEDANMMPPEGYYALLEEPCLN